VVGAPGYALRTDHGNPESTDYLINPFAQLDAHNCLSARHTHPFFATTVPHRGRNPLSETACA